MVDVMIHSSEDGMSFKNKNKKWDGWMDGWMGGWVGCECMEKKKERESSKTIPTLKCWGDI
jgi:hypothetical protein